MLLIKTTYQELNKLCLKTTMTTEKKPWNYCMLSCYDVMCVNNKSKHIYPVKESACAIQLTIYFVGNNESEGFQLWKCEFVQQKSRSILCTGKWNCKIHHQRSNRGHQTCRNDSTMTCDLMLLETIHVIKQNYMMGKNHVDYWEEILGILVAELL